MRMKTHGVQGRLRRPYRPRPPALAHAPVIAGHRRSSPVKQYQPDFSWDRVTAWSCSRRCVQGRRRWLPGVRRRGGRRSRRARRCCGGPPFSVAVWVRRRRTPTRSAGGLPPSRRSARPSRRCLRTATARPPVVLAVAGPGLGQVELSVDQGVAAGGGVGGEDPDLTILGAACGAGVLALHTGGGSALLHEACVVDDQYAVVSAPRCSAIVILPAVPGHPVVALSQSPRLPSGHGAGPPPHSRRLPRSHRRADCPPGGRRRTRAGHLRVGSASG